LGFAADEGSFGIFLVNATAIVESLNSTRCFVPNYGMAFSSFYSARFLDD
jgi:hypothetical protein